MPSGMRNAFTNFDPPPIVLHPESEAVMYSTEPMEEPVLPQEAEAAPAEETDDFEMPAFLKRERRLFQ